MRNNVPVSPFAFVLVILLETLFNKASVFCSILVRELMTPVDRGGSLVPLLAANRLVGIPFAWRRFLKKIINAEKTDK